MKSRMAWGLAAALGAMVLPVAGYLLVQLGAYWIAKNHGEGAHLSGVSLPRASLAHANLNGANLSRSHLWSADLRGAALSSANLQMADLRGARLDGAFLEGDCLGGP